MPRAIIADDEPLLRDALRDALLELWPELEIVGESSDGLETLKLIEDKCPDICFLDIRMPRLSGLEVAERIQGSTAVVFVTAYDEHAVAAFEQGAADYLLKPIKPNRLMATIQRLRDRIGAQVQAQHRSFLERIQATAGNTLRFVPIDEIACFRSDGKYTRVCAANGDALIRKPLAALLEHLDPERFWRIHRGIIVNVDRIDRVMRDRDGLMTVIMRDSQASLPVSKSHQHQFRGM